MLQILIFEPKETQVWIYNKFNKLLHNNLKEY